MTDDQVVYFHDEPICRVTGWDGDIPTIAFGSPLSGPLDSAIPVAGMPSEPLCEAPADDASPRTRGDEPATTPDPAHGAVGVASPSGPAVAVTGGGGAGSVIQGRRRHLF